MCCRGITKTFGAGEAQVQALRGSTLRCIPAKLLMLVGPSGCGKTTLISVIAGILDHDDGDCVLYGQDLRQFSPNDRAAFAARTSGSCSRPSTWCRP